MGYSMEESKSNILAFYRVGEEMFVHDQLNGDSVSGGQPMAEA